MFSGESYKVFKKRFVCFYEIMIKKAFWMILQYFRNSSCKSLSTFCYLIMPKFFQCHRHPGAPQEKSIPSVNDHPSRNCWHIPKILWKRPVYPDYFFLCDYDINKMGNDETVHFRNFYKLFLLHFFCGILAPHFQTGKKKWSHGAHEECWNAGCHIVPNWWSC